MDPRFLDSMLLNRRKEECDPIKIKDYITDIFSNISLLDGWSACKSEWVKPVENIKLIVYLKFVTFQDLILQCVLLLL